MTKGWSRGIALPFLSSQTFPSTNVEIQFVFFRPFNIYVIHLEFSILFTKIDIEVNLGCTKEFSPRKKTTINIGKKIWKNKKNMDQIKL